MTDEEHRAVCGARALAFLGVDHECVLSPAPHIGQHQDRHGNTWFNLIDAVWDEEEDE